MMRSIIGSMDGWWRCMRVMQCCYRTASWCWVSSGSSTYQGTDKTVTRMRWMSGGIVTVMVRNLGMNNIFMCTYVFLLKSSGEKHTKSIFRLFEITL